MKRYSRFVKRYFLLLIVVALLSCSGNSGDSRLSNTSKVDLFIGTATDHGQLSPAATLPFGMVKVCPDAVKPSHVGYDYRQEQIRGISVNRAEGVGCRGTGGNISLRPARADEPLSIVRLTEKAEPGYYATELSSGAFVELTATRSVAIERYTYSATGSEQLMHIDLSTAFVGFAGASYNVDSSQSITGEVSAANTCGEGRYKIYFDMNFNEPFDIVSSDSLSLLLSFSSREVEVRIALSPISREVASCEQQAAEGLTFEQIKESASMQWSDALSSVEVEGGDSIKERLFYTMLYRTMLSPVDVTSSRGEYLNTNGEVVKADGFRYYSSWSIWDTFRNKFPMLCLLQRERMGDFCRSLIELYRSGKVAWATMHESAPTVRTEHSSILLLDAYNRGVEGIDFTRCYDSLLVEMERLPMVSPDNYLESAYDLWAMSQIGTIVGDSLRSEEFFGRAEQTWRAIWSEKFKDINNDTFDIMHGDGLYEGTLWQYRWAVQYAISDMAEMVGGTEKLSEQLDYFFSHDLFNIGNQPDIHAPYLFNELGYPHLTQYWVNRIINTPMRHCYGTHDKFKEPYYDLAFKAEPTAFIPEMDDDDGTMSGWYLCSAMGLYPDVPGRGNYSITTPQFERVVINLDGGQKFTIECDNFSPENIYIEKIFLNGQPYDSYFIDHKTITNGGELKLILSKKQ